MADYKTLKISTSNRPSQVPLRYLSGIGQVPHSPLLSSESHPACMSNYGTLQPKSTHTAEKILPIVTQFKRFSV